MLQEAFRSTLSATRVLGEQQMPNMRSIGCARALTCYADEHLRDPLSETSKITGAAEKGWARSYSGLVRPSWCQRGHLSHLACYLDPLEGAARSEWTKT